MARGYLQKRSKGKKVLAHVWVWEQAHGPVPNGYLIRHRDENKRNNDLANLELVTPSEHARIHSPNYRRNDAGEWERRCNVCRKWKPANAEHYYVSPEGYPLYGRCRRCHIAYVMAR